MRSFPFIAIATAAMLLTATAAVAFSTDDKTLTNATGSPRFSDPDDQTPTSLFTNGQQGGNSNGQYNGNYAPSAAPFSPSSATPAGRK